MAARRGESQIVLSDQDKELYAEFKRKKAEEDERLRLEEINSNKIVTILDMGLYLPRLALRCLAQVVEILSPIGYEEFKQLSEMYRGHEGGIHSIKPHDENLEGYVLVLNGDSVMNPNKHINRVAPLGCIAMHRITLKDQRMTRAERSRTKKALRKYIKGLLTAPKPSLSWVTVEDNVARDTDSWSEFLPDSRAHIGIYHNKRDSSYVILINSHMGEQIVEDISAMIRERPGMTAEQFGTNHALNHLRTISSRNVSRILSRILSILSEKDIILPDPSVRDDTAATIGKYAEYPAFTEPHESLRYNDFYWVATTRKLCLYYNLSGGHTPVSASKPTTHQFLIGPYLRGFKIFDHANHLARVRAEDRIHGHIFNTGISPRKEVNLEKGKIVSVLKKTKLDYSAFEKDDVYLSKYYHDSASDLMNQDNILTYSTDLVFIP